MSKKQVRLSVSEVNAIKEAFGQHFASKDHLWLFGSRTNPEERGGDIDLYIETTIHPSAEALNRKISFVCDLYERIGLQKIDVVLNVVGSDFHLPIYDVAKSEGMKLV